MLWFFALATQRLKHDVTYRLPNIWAAWDWRKHERNPLILILYPWIYLFIFNKTFKFYSLKQVSKEPRQLHSSVVMMLLFMVEKRVKRTKNATQFRSRACWYIRHEFFDRFNFPWCKQGQISRERPHGLMLFDMISTLIMIKIFQIDCNKNTEYFFRC